MINVSDLKPGVTFQMDGNLFVVLDYSHNKTARAAANIRIKMKNLRSGATTEITFGGNDKVKKAHVDKSKMQYLYNSGEALVFMDNETYEQIALTEEAVGDSMKFVKENDNVKMVSYKGNIFAIEPPMFAELEVTETEPGVKGDTATNVTKPATVETGAQVAVPIFVNQGDKIQIDTRTGEYLKRL